MTLQFIVPANDPPSWVLIVLLIAIVISLAVLKKDKTRQAFKKHLRENEFFICLSEEDNE
jgi:hypothetical protein